MKNCCINRYNWLPGKEKKKVDEVAKFYWCVSKGCVRECDNSISQIYMISEILNSKFFELFILGETH
jgi:hypothetical protein